MPRGSERQAPSSVLCDVPPILHRTDNLADRSFLALSLASSLACLIPPTMNAHAHPDSLPALNSSTFRSIGHHVASRSGHGLFSTGPRHHHFTRRAILLSLLPRLKENQGGHPRSAHPQLRLRRVRHQSRHIGQRYQLGLLTFFRS